MPANVKSMVYYGEKPWHGLGKKVDHAMTSAEAIKEAGLDWEVITSPIFDKTQDGYREVQTHKAVIRQDTNTVLGIVGKDRYTPVQNREAFSFFDAVVGEKAAMYHTAGALGNGERVWILAKLPGDIVVLKNDVVEKYLLLANSHDGTLRLTMMFSPIRVVCQNTLNLALGDESETKVRLKHTPNIGLKTNKIQEALGIANRKYTLFSELSKKLAVTQLTVQAWESYRNRVVGVDTGKEIPTRTQNTLLRLTELFESGKGTDIKGVKGTSWAGFNAFAEYVDFAKGRRGKENQEENRANDLLFGQGALLKQRAWDLAIDNKKELAAVSKVWPE